MEITPELIRHLATLARLEFTGSELEQFSQDFSSMIRFVETVNSVNTDGVEPLIHLNTDLGHTREDEVYNWTIKKEALQNAPKKDSDYFRVPKVLQ
jgi:aspartyl-tRNA(Asn)/glutamyl-tRNA(Gln) amidotransferase subunit C